MKYLLFFFFLLTVCQVLGQPKIPEGGVEITKAIPPSPDAAALGKYGSIPVSAYTGVPNISVPLYDAKSGDISLPISISYHAGGNKVEESASSVGLGWTLNCGGAITRTVRGMADEDASGFIDPQHYITSLDAKINHGTGSLSTADASTYLNNIAMGSMDGESDVYNFNFGGYSGKFEFNPNGIVTIIPQQNIKFSFTISYAPLTHFSQFVAQTPDGVKYYFGSVSDGNDAIEYTQLQSKKNYATSWFIKKIVSPTGHTIFFNYVPASYDLPFHPQSETNYTPLFTSDNIAGSPSKPNGSIFTTVAQSFAGVRLRSVAFDNGSVIVTSGINRNDIPGNATAISSISVNSAGLTKTFNFYYSNNTSTTRLRLDSLVGLLDQISGTNNFNKEKYKFTYSADPWSPNGLYSQDWWGYYNGRSASVNGAQTLVPSYALTSTYSLPGANRSSDESSMLGGMLTRIDYPTGGYTNFAFEANQEYNVDLQGTSSRYPVSYYTEAISNDPSSNYYQYYDGCPDCNSIFQVYSINNSAPFSYSASGLQGATPTDEVRGILYKQDASGNMVNCITLNNTTAPDTVIYLPNGSYKLGIIDTKGQSTRSNNPVLYTIVATWSNANSALINNYIVGGLRVHQIADYDGVNPNPINLKVYTYNRPGQAVSSGWLDYQPSYNYFVNYENIPSSASGGGQLSPVLSWSTFLVRAAVSNYPLATTQGSVVGYSHVIEMLGGSAENGQNEYYYYNSQTYPDMQQGSPGSNTDPSLGPTMGFPFAPAAAYDWHRGLLTREINYKKLPGGTYQPVKQLVNTYSTISNSGNIGIKVGFYQVPLTPNIATDYYNGDRINYGRLAQVTYNDVTDYTYMSSDTTWVYGVNDPTRYTVSWHNYQYDPVTYQITQLQTANSKNELLTKKVTYPYNYTASNTPGSLQGIYNLNNMGIMSYPVEDITQLSNLDGSNLRTTKAILTTYKPNQPLRDTVFETRSVIPLTTFAASTAGSSNFVKDSHYQPIVAFNKYDAVGNIIQETTIGDITHSYIWGYFATNVSPAHNSYPIAEVTNADSSSIAYTNFESYTTNGSSYGNWTYSNAGTIADATAPMGTNCYSLSGQTISKSGMAPATSYILSFWAKQGAAVTLNGSTPTASSVGSAKNGWTYYEYSVTGTTSIAIAGSGFIDELRLYPANAQMSTYTYIPLVGMSSKCDTKNEITYYNYDNVGRLILIKDLNGNILKNYQYNYTSRAQ